MELILSLKQYVYNKEWKYVKFKDKGMKQIIEVLFKPVKLCSKDNCGVYKF